MAVSINTLYQEALGMIEVKDGTNMSDPRWTKTKVRIANDVATVLQKVYAAMPAVMLDRPDSAPVRPPTTIAGLAVTQYSKTFTGTVPTWAIGCTVLLPGDPNYNRILSTTGLLAPYMGTSGTVDATAWCDAILPSFSSAAIEAPVTLAGYGQLNPVMARANLTPRDAWREMMMNQRIVGRPTQYFVEAISDDTNGIIKPRILIDPLPDISYRLDFQVKLAAPTVSVDDLTDTAPLLVPLGYGESILVPMLRAEFSSFESFSGDKQAIREAGKVAFATLGSATKLQGPIKQSYGNSQNW